ncbi:MAG: RIP metalloprotease RseP [Gammaproteobacteria bacterium]|nr:RIP metalloprotease RseP [Gammaproteobacteria bacterium]MCW8840688.1 RIP metalloprotease RseP [Gammaproteobacteria bacterium]MCW8927669.1 RIP metalloprotease RseP [Gammaproteobacteria bacterium]MCW8959053.1 RIP metalloprotease RseP [Gammaproteobacteria bacterium]MCW8973144.1 RIP metalloprotease RseP [Gammaproteobacteria bacterium]
MINILLTILSLLVALSLLIAVHELGHFLVARWSGVKVLRFSIGFGKPLWQRRFGADQTEFTLASIPLGGYVKMLDEREGEVADEELHRAFNRQPLSKRTAVVVAGPLFNFIFAIFAYWLMFVVGVSGIKPLLGEIEAGTIAYEAGLRGGQEILTVDGKETPTWQSAVEAIMPKMMLNETVNLTVFDGGITLEKQLVFSGIAAESKPQELFDKLGLKVYQPPIEPIIGEVLSGSVADRAGVVAGDRVITAAGRAITTWQQLVDTISEHPGKRLELVVEREGAEVVIALRPESIDSADGPVGRIGAAVNVDPLIYQSLQSEMRYGAVPAVAAALGRTWEMSTLTLKMIGEMIMGRASVENLSGPIGIAQYAKQSASAGFSQFLKFLGLISVSLGVLNLLPIPVLDGGHLLYYAIEAIRGRPVSEQFEAMGQRVGLAVILVLMIVAVYNDLLRLAVN